MMKQRAFSLVEVMVVAAVVGISGSMALFAMSEQVADARAKSEAQALLQDIRAEHRTAKERMRGLKITTHPSSDTNPNHTVTFQPTDPRDCTKPEGAARTVEFKFAHLKMNQAKACFNERGELLHASNPGGTRVIPRDNLDSGSLSEGEGEGEVDPLTMDIEFGARPKRMSRRALRIDKTTVNEETLVRRVLSGDSTGADPALSFAP
jgi:prepilin-type N-terminal cleavage/methylation domain-containing protein